MQKHPTDPIISEVRAVRDAHAARFDYDMVAIFRDIRMMQEVSEREYVRFPARPVVTSEADYSLSSNELVTRITGSK